MSLILIFWEIVLSRLQLDSSGIIRSLQIFLAPFSLLLDLVMEWHGDCAGFIGWWPSNVEKSAFVHADSLEMAGAFDIRGINNMSGDPKSIPRRTKVPPFFLWKQSEGDIMLVLWSTRRFYPTSSAVQCTCEDVRGKGLFQYFDGT